MKNFKMYNSKNAVSCIHRVRDFDVRRHQVKARHKGLILSSFVEFEEVK